MLQQSNVLVYPTLRFALNVNYVFSVIILLNLFCVEGSKPRLAAGFLMIGSPVTLQREYGRFANMPFLKERNELGLANLTKHYELGGELVEMKEMSNMSPVDIVNQLCDKLFSKNVNVVFYATVNDDVVDHTAAARFTIATIRFLQLPLVMWIGDNSLNLQVSSKLTDHYV